MRLVTALVVLTVLCGCLRPPADAAEGPALYTLSLPGMLLQGGERISSIRVDLVGARVQAVNTVLEDWSVEIRPVQSGHWAVTMSATLDTVSLRSTYGLGRFLTVAADGGRLTGITASLKVSGGAGGEREIAIPSGDLALEPLPRR
jgi:hypothetical protein